MDLLTVDELLQEVGKRSDAVLCVRWAKSDSYSFHLHIEGGFLLANGLIKLAQMEVDKQNAKFLASFDLKNEADDDKDE